MSGFSNENAALEQRVNARTDAVLNRYHQLREASDAKLEERYETFEQQLAIVTQAYAELAAVVEALYGSIVNKTDDEREEFYKNLSAAQKNMLDALNNAVHDAERDADRFVAHPSDPAERSTSDESGEQQ